MNIQCFPPGGGQLVQIAGPDPKGLTSLSWPVNGKLDPQWQEQVITGLRASAAQVLNRGNLVTTLQYQVHQQFSSVIAAWTFALALIAQLNVLNSTGTGCTVLIQPSDGGSHSNFYIANAIVHFSMPTQIGVDMRFDFRIRGGAVTTANPNQGGQ